MRYGKLLDAHVDGELTGPRAAKVANHVSHCEMCRGAALITMVVKRRLALRRLLA
jgi:anti-sigma factor RsiW